VQGSDAQALQGNFAKAMQIVAALQQQQHAQGAPVMQQEPSPLKQAQHHGTTNGSVSQEAETPSSPNDVVKAELLHIRQALLTALQRTENLYKALQ